MESQQSIHGERYEDYWLMDKMLYRQPGNKKRSYIASFGMQIQVQRFQFSKWED